MDDVSPERYYSEILDYIFHKEYPTDYDKVERKTVRKRSENHAVEDGKLYYVDGNKKKKVLVTSEEQESVMRREHVNHQGVHRDVDLTMTHINDRYHWRNLRDSVESFVRNCQECAGIKAAVWKEVAVQLLGPFERTTKKGNRLLLMVTDKMSKWFEMVPMAAADTQAIADFIIRTFTKMGCAEIDFVDTEGQLKNSVMKAVHASWESHKEAEQRWKRMSVTADSATAAPSDPHQATIKVANHSPTTTTTITATSAELGEAIMSELLQFVNGSEDSTQPITVVVETINLPFQNPHIQRLLEFVAAFPDSWDEHLDIILQELYFSPPDGETRSPYQIMYAAGRVPSAFLLRDRNSGPTNQTQSGPSGGTAANVEAPEDVSTIPRVIPCAKCPKKFFSPYTHELHLRYHTEMEECADTAVPKRRGRPRKVIEVIEIEDSGAGQDEPVRVAGFLDSQDLQDDELRPMAYRLRANIKPKANSGGLLKRMFKQSSARRSGLVSEEPEPKRTKSAGSPSVAADTPTRALQNEEKADEGDNITVISLETTDGDVSIISLGEEPKEILGIVCKEEKDEEEDEDEEYEDEAIVGTDDATDPNFAAPPTPKPRSPGSAVVTKPKSSFIHKKKRHRGHYAIKSNKTRPSGEGENTTPVKPKVRLPIKCPKCVMTVLSTGVELNIHLACHRDDSKLLRCTVCSYVSGSWSPMEHHLRGHPEIDFDADEPDDDKPVGVYVTEVRKPRKRKGDDDPPLKCDQCVNTLLASKKELEFHLYCHKEGSRLLRCPYCAHVSGNWTHMQRHLSEHPEVPAEVCTVPLQKRTCLKCERVFPSLETMLRHFQAHKSECRFHCDKCGMSFKEKKTLHRHLEAHDNITYQCDSCNYRTKIKSSLIEHLRIHEGGGYQCHVCSKIFARPANLAAHMQIHNINRPAAICELCGARLASVGTLRHHMRYVHGDPQQWPCTMCNYIGKSKSNLTGHMDRVHNKTFKCQYCAYACLAESTLSKHVDIFHNAVERRYACNKCPYRARDPKHLTEHVRLKHNPLAHRFPCQICGQRFKTMTMLRHHLPSHTGQYLYFCQLCGYKAKYRPNLHRHVLTKHPGYSVSSVMKGTASNNIEGCPDVKSIEAVIAAVQAEEHIVSSDSLTNAALEAVETIDGDDDGDVDGEDRGTTFVSMDQENRIVLDASILSHAGASSITLPNNIRLQIIRDDGHGNKNVAILQPQDETDKAVGMLLLTIDQNQLATEVVTEETIATSE